MWEHLSCNFEVSLLIFSEISNTKLQKYYGDSILDAAGYNSFKYIFTVPIPNSFIEFNYTYIIAFKIVLKLTNFMFDFESLFSFSFFG